MFKIIDMPLNKLIYPLVFLFLTTSCRQLPEGLELRPPRVENATAVVDGNSVAFSAMVTGDVTGVVEYGFMLGLSEDEMIKLDADVNKGVLEASVSDLEWKSEYLYYAYVSNGHTMVRSDLHSFKTAPCKLRFVQWFPDTGGGAQSIPILVQGVDSFSVSFSEGADWISLQHGQPPFECDDLGWYYIYADIEENRTGSPRSCDVIITCGECGHVTTLSFTQYSM